MREEPTHHELGIAGKLAHAFINSKLTPLFIAASLAVGIFAVAIFRVKKSRRLSFPCSTS